MDTVSDDYSPLLHVKVIYCFRSVWVQVSSELCWSEK